MAIKESALTLITSIAQGDWIRAVTSAGASRRVTVANLAKAIVESYTGSSLAGSNQSVKAAIDSLNSNQVYKAGDVFTARRWRAMGRSINSGKGIFCWIDFGKPITASGATFSLGSINTFFANDATAPTYANTVSSIDISGNELYFVLDTTNTLEAGKLYLLELSGTAITLT